MNARGLGRREREILGLFAQGLTKREVAAALSLSPYTVRTHQERAAKKLGARNTAHAVQLAWAQGILTEPERR